MLPETCPARLRMSGAFSCHQTRKPSQVGARPGEGRGKGKALALDSDLPYAASFCDTWGLCRRSPLGPNVDGLQQRSLLVVELDDVIRRPQDRTAAVVA